MDGRLVAKRRLVAKVLRRRARVALAWQVALAGLLLVDVAAGVWVAITALPWPQDFHGVVSLGWDLMQTETPPALLLSALTYVGMRLYHQLARMHHRRTTMAAAYLALRDGSPDWFRRLSRALGPLRSSHGGS